MFATFALDFFFNINTIDMDEAPSLLSFPFFPVKR